MIKYVVHNESSDEYEFLNQKELDRYLNKLNNMNDWDAEEYETVKIFKVEIKEKFEIIREFKLKKL